MNYSPITRILTVLMMLLTLLACNLSGPAGTFAEITQVVVTATPNGQRQANSEVTRASTVSTVALNTQSGSQVSSGNDAQSDDMYYVRGNRPQNQCTIQATVTTNIRTAPNLSATIRGQLIGGEWVTVLNHSNGWYQINLLDTPVHQLWISDDPTTLDNRCHCDTDGCTYYSPAPSISTPTLDSTLYYAGDPLPAPPDRCYVFTAGDFNVNIRDAQSETAKILGQLPANHWIPVRHFVNGWFGIDLPNTPVDGAYIFSGPSQLTSTCVCTDISCSIQSGMSVCELSTHVNTTTKIHTEPANWSAVVGELTTGITYRVVASSTSGWYQLEVGGWVPPNFLEISSGDGCRNLLRITYDAPLLDCQLLNSTDDIVTIWTEPNGEYFGRFWNNNSLPIIKREGDWYQVYVAAFGNAGWVDGSEITLTGDCGDFE